MKRFNHVSVNLPELKTETAVTTTDTTPDVAKLSAQTAQAFGDVKPFYYDEDKIDTPKYTEMYKKGKEPIPQSMTTGTDWSRARQAMTSDAAYRGVTPSDRQPGFEIANRMRKQDTTPAGAIGVDKRGYENIGKIDETPPDKKILI